MKHISYKPLLATLVFSLFIGCGQSGQRSDVELEDGDGGGINSPPFGQSDLPGLIPDGSDPNSSEGQIGSQSPSAPSVGAPSSQNPFAGLSPEVDNGQAPLSMPSNYNYANLIPNITSLVPFVDPRDPNMFPNPDRFIPFFNRYYCSVFALLNNGAQQDLEAAYVTALYFDVLGRLPEPSGLAYWMNALTNVLSDSSRETVARGIFLSDESARRIVNGLYRTALQRARGVNEGLGWVNMVKAGDIEGAAAGVYGSVEAFNKSYLGGKNPTKYIAYLYRKILGRTGSAWEYRFWVNRRNQRNLNNRVLTVREIMQSFESEQKYVESMYGQYLGRAAEPAGLQAWLNVMQANALNRAQVAIKFLAASEYLGVQNNGVSLGLSRSAKGRFMDPNHLLINLNFCQ